MIKRLALMLMTCLAASAMAQSLQVQVLDASGAPLAQAVVYLESPAAQRRVQPMPTQKITQIRREFVPAVLPITRGTQVEFPNEDTVRHHVYSFSPAKRFELRLYVGTPPEPVLFDRAGVVVLGCNIHDDMVAWVVVLDTPHFGTTDAQGRVQIDGMPSGDYQLRVWHERLPANAQPHTQTLRWSGDPQALEVVVRGLIGS